MLNKHLFSENVEFSVFTGLKCDRSSPLRNIWLVTFHCVNEGEQQLTSALYGRKIAEAKLPVMPLRMYMMEMRSQPASFSRSLRMVIWKATDTRQCKILQEHRGCGTKKKKSFTCPERAREWMSHVFGFKEKPTSTHQQNGNPSRRRQVRLRAVRTLCLITQETDKTQSEEIKPLSLLGVRSTL